jgi:hypothetical protein
MNIGERDEDGSMNKTHIGMLVTAFAALLSFSSVSGASTIYNLVDHTNADYTVSGTITTDDTLGSISVANIEGWTVNVTGLESFSFSSSDPNAATLDLNFPAGVVATSTDITVSGAGNFRLVGDTTSNYQPQWGYSNGTMFLHGVTQTNLSAVDIGQEGNVVFATAVVPVPAAAWLFGSGLIGLIGVAKRKQSKA